MPFTSQVKLANEYDLLKELVFSNDSGTITLFTVTGDVIVRIMPICSVDLVSAAAANMELGISADTDAIIPSTLATDLTIKEIWVDASPTISIEAERFYLEFIISNGDDIILTLDAQIDSGSIDFFCEWEPLSVGASVVLA